MALHPIDDGCVLVLSDGAGGVSGGAEAAELVLAAVEEALVGDLDPHDPATWPRLLVDLDRRIEEASEAGECTAVILTVTRRRIVGSSVGNSRALLFTRGGRTDVTARQHRRPLLGSGGARPVALCEASRVGRLLVASDGLWDYLPMRDVERLLAEERDPETTLERFLAGLRLPSGKLRDDVSMALVDTL